MADKYMRLPNGNKIKYYSFAITNALIAKFINTDMKELKDFFGTNIIDYIDITNDNDDILETYNLYMKLKTITSETTTIMEYEDRIVKDSWTDDDGIEHEALTEKIQKEVPCDLVTVILEKPSTSEELDNIKSVVGIVNTNNMTLDEFKDYYKTQIGKLCTSAIEAGSDVETSKGTQHFSYTIEDQSNIKDLVIIWLLVEVLKSKLGSDINITFPYHSDGNLCDVYESNDILKIYMALSSNKTYHTTYCNLLNAIINGCKDMNSVKSITYGMEIKDEKYLEVINKVNESKDTLLQLVAQVIELTSFKDSEITSDDSKTDGESKDNSSSISEDNSKDKNSNTDDTIKDNMNNTDNKENSEEDSTEE